MNNIVLSLFVLSQCILYCYSQQQAVATLSANQVDQWIVLPDNALASWSVISGGCWGVSLSPSVNRSQILSIQNLPWSGIPDGSSIEQISVNLFYKSSLTGNQISDELVSLNNETWSAPTPRIWNVTANTQDEYNYTVNNDYNWTTSVVKSPTFNMHYQVGIADGESADISLCTIVMTAIFVAPSPSPMVIPSSSTSTSPSPTSPPTSSSSTSAVASASPSANPSIESTPSMSSTPANSSSKNKSKNNAALIGGAVGGSVGGLCLLAILLALVFVFRRKKRQQEDHGAELQAQGLSPDPSIFDNSDIHLKDVKILHMLGKGKFGEVYEGLWSDTTPVACKKLKQGERTEFENEIKLISKLNHPNIVRCLGIYVPDADTTYMVLELLKLGSLADFLRKPQSQWKLSVDNLVELCLNTAAGMSYLESKNIVHRDLGARNLLVTESDGKYIVKVSDFGLSRQVESDIYNASENVFPVRWSPPEVINYRKFSTKSDVWSFAVTCWEIFEWGKLPYPSMSNQECLDQVIGGYRLPQPKTCPDSIYKLMTECWKENPTARPDFKNIYTTIKNILADMKPDQKKENKKNLSSQSQQHQDHYNTASNANDGYNT